ncbi:hypothetical protein D3P08_22265 [Paenibacillus nanensis]|uniref:YtkA-like domain-containing protein n=1 Tax=Paenibacillus nanensis TaxID=393251 RepID=A0A3A1UNT2_9BACL|nr:hypothetical protein [Paenibacillus nanensis]RIX49994.1 hypothetical protein D3P08_22265 [Paenibacillus nanensis]
MRIIVLIAIAFMLSACQAESEMPPEPPIPAVEVNGEKIHVLQSSYCWTSSCADYAAPEERLRDEPKAVVPAEAAIQFSFDGKQPDEVTATSFHNGKRSQAAVSGHAFSAPSEEGVYYYSLSAVWWADKENRITNGSSSYVFALEVTAKE